MLPHLVANFAVVGIFAAFWINVQDWAVAQRPLNVGIAFGLVMGAAAIMSLTISVDVQGFFIDLRAVPIAVAALVGGWIPGLIAAVLTAIARLIAGGAGAPLGVVSIGLAFACGLAGFFIRRSSRNWLFGLTAAAVLTGARSLVLLPFIPTEAREVSLANLPLTLPMNAIAIMAIGFAVLRGRHRARQRALLLGAVAQAPDYFYVKDPDSRIVAANRNVAKIHGRHYAWQLEGLSDTDLKSPERALELIKEEQVMLSSGSRIVDKDEEIADENGNHRSFVTSKSPVYSGNGNLLGLVGVTKDVTTFKTMQRELAEGRDRLDFVLHEMSDGVCLYDARGNIILTNARFRELFPRTGHLRVPGAFLPAILQTVLDMEEQLDASAMGQKEWMAEAMAALRNGGDQVIQLFDGSWLRLRTRVHSNGVAITVASDITSMKHAEIELLSMTKQLELLSVTDGLTQLVNRRGFDEALRREVARAMRNDRPLSVILMDIDRFKAFNDRYGHVEGDECLRKVASAVSRVVNRPGDVVARYGGEEIAIILADTDLEGAHAVAEKVRTEIRALAIPHEASEKQIVTASFGLATADPKDPAMTGKVVLTHADKALYQAKAEGRDRSTIWSGNEAPYRQVS